MLFIKRSLFFYLLLYGVFSGFLVPESQAEIFTYKDSSGQTHYVNNLTKIPEEYREQATSAELPKIGRTDFKGFKVTKKTNSNKKVEVFVTDWCPYCSRLTNFLNRQGIRYKEYNIERSAIGRQRHAQMGGGGVPVTKIGSNVIRGYQPDAIMRAIRSNR